MLNLPRKALKMQYCTVWEKRMPRSAIGRRLFPKARMLTVMVVCGLTEEELRRLVGFLFLEHPTLRILVLHCPPETKVQNSEEYFSQTHSVIACEKHSDDRSNFYFFHETRLPKGGPDKGLEQIWHIVLDNDLKLCL